MVPEGNAWARAWACTSSASPGGGRSVGATSRGRKATYWPVGAWR